MSIQSFLDAAQILYDNQKYNEALCLVCSAVDACAKKEFPDEKGNANCYKKFLEKYFIIICKSGFPGIIASDIRIKVNAPSKSLKTDANGYVDMEQILYHVIRCGLVHECSIDETVTFTDETIIGDWDKQFFLPQSIILGLIDAVKFVLKDEIANKQ